MTDPAQAKTVKVNQYETTRKYSWPPMPPHEFTVTSVTSAIKHGLPKPFLPGWAAKKTAECAVSDHDIIGAMLKKGDKKAALSHLKGSRYRDMTAKGDRGNVVHASIDAYLQGKEYSEADVDEKIKELQVPHYMVESTKGMILGAMAFLYDTEPEVLWNESTVYSRTHKFAGTADIICKLHIGTTRVPVIVDFKTSPNIYDETALQLAAYANADFVGHNDGTEGELVPGGEPIENGVVIRPKANGTYDRADFTLTPDVFSMFLHALGVAEGVQNDTLAKSRRPTVQ